MFDPKILDDLSKRMADGLPPGLQAVREDVERNMRSSLEAGFAKLNLVTREEFDVQRAVLARTRERLAALEARLAELEGETSTSDTNNAESTD